MKTNTHCIKCEALGKKRKRKAAMHVKENGIDIPLCLDCYKEWLMEEDYSINLKEENDGCFLQGSQGIEF